jgi:hypothetical protein
MGRASSAARGPSPAWRRFVGPLFLILAFVVALFGAFAVQSAKRGAAPAKSRAARGAARAASGAGAVVLVLGPLHSTRSGWPGRSPSRPTLAVSAAETQGLQAPRSAGIPATNPPRDIGPFALAALLHWGAPNGTDRAEHALRRVSPADLDR